MRGLHSPEIEIQHNAKLKLYPDGYSLTIANKPIFIESGWEVVGDNPKKPKPKNMDGEIRPDNIKRAKQKVMDIARLNTFQWFITWTLDKREIDRYDPKEVSRKLKTFLMNKVKRNAAVYLIIAEYHKNVDDNNGQAIHMHGLLSGNFKMVDSGKKTKSGQTIYNMSDWKLGFSTAIELDENISAISRYITKYISKDFCKIFGSFYYAGGHNLIRKPQYKLFNLDYASVNIKEYSNEYLSFKYKDFADEIETANFISEHRQGGGYCEHSTD